MLPAALRRGRREGREGSRRDQGLGCAWEEAGWQQGRLTGSCASRVSLEPRSRDAEAVAAAAAEAEAEFDCYKEL